MGFANSSCSFTRFRILDPVPATLWPQILDKLKQFAMRDIDDIPEMQGQGWACFEDMLDTDWVTAPPQKGAYIVFSLRLDMRRIPAGVVKKHVALALKEEKKRMGEQGKNYIARERKKDLFLEEFLKTFELHLEQLTPYNLAVSMLDEESLIRLDKLEPTQFAPLS